MIPEEMLLPLTVLFVVVMAPIIFVTQSRRQKALRVAALGVRRGWTIAYRKASLPPGLRLQVRPHGKAWSLTTRAPAPGIAGQTAWHDPTLRHEGGLLLLGPAMAPAALAAQSDTLGNLEAGAGRALLLDLLGADAPTDARVRSITQPPGRSFTMLGIGAGSGRLDLDAIDAAIGAWTRRHGDPALFPIVSLGEDGLKVRLRSELRELDRIEAFADLAQQLRGAVAPA